MTNKTTNLDLKGRRFNILTVIEPLKERVHGNVMWLCQCDCGAQTTVRGGSLTSGNTKSCGCLKHRIRKGNVYGHLTAVKQLPKEKSMPKWLCSCECGKETEVFSGNLLSGNTKSCGCIRTNETISEGKRLAKRMILSTNNTVHYSTWRRKVVTRDNNTCVICGYNHSKNYDMVAHHLDGFEWCEDKRVDVNNGVTLCYDCHQEFHRIYGSRNNTKEQFNEYKDAKITA